MQGADSATTPPAVWVASFDDPHAMAAAQREAKLEYLAIGRGAYRSDIAMVEFGPFAVQSSRDGAHITRGAVRPDRFALLFMHGGTGASGNGWAGTEAGSLILGPGAELRCLVPQPLSWVCYTLDAGWCEAALDGDGLPGQGQFTIAPDLIARVPALRGLAQEIEAVSRHDPGRLGWRAVAGAVEEGLRHALVQGVLPAETGLRALRQRMRLVAAADEYLDARHGQAVYTQDLVAALGTPARTLHTAFASVYGMPLHHYLKIRRLNLVRAQLRAGEAGAAQVKGAALTHGFWHLGRFARDYRALFGETPSATLAGRR